MGYWTDKPFSKPSKSSKNKPAKQSGWWAQPVGGDKCPLCKKPVGLCSHSKQKMTPEKEKVKKEVDVKQKDGTVKKQNRTVTRNAGYSKDDRGILWCDTCSSRVVTRVMSGDKVCTNITCSTHKK